jgi:site-specific DNA-cytosine methylase
MIKASRDQILREYDLLEKNRQMLALERHQFEEYKKRETLLIENVKSMYTKHIEYFMLIKEVLEKYQLSPSQLKEVVESHLKQ